MVPDGIPIMEDIIKRHDDAKEKFLENHDDYLESP